MIGQITLDINKEYSFRILEIENQFYPQIYIKSFWNTGWYYICEPDNYILQKEKPAFGKWYKHIDSARNLLIYFRNDVTQKCNGTKINIHDYVTQKFHL